MTQIQRSSARTGDRSRAKVVLIRQPVKSVRQGDQRDPVTLRIVLSLVGGLGAIACVWLVGYLGYRLGYGPAVRVPELVGDPGGGLATGTLMLAAFPRLILQAGLAEPMWLMIGFLMIALPAGVLTAAKPTEPGGPKLHPSMVTLAYCAAALAGAAAGLIIWWSASSFRLTMMGELPADPAEALTWAESTQTAAGLDLLAVIAAVLWMVLCFRLPIVLWSRVLAAAATIFALAVVTISMASSGAAAAQLNLDRSICLVGYDEMDRCLMLGSTRDHLVLLLVSDGQTVVELRDTAMSMEVLAEQRSIIEFLDEAADGQPSP